MRTLNQWLREYAISHTNPTNKLIHRIFVPAIMFSILGLLWVIPIPNAFTKIELLNWSTLFTICCLAFYLYLDFKMFIGMFAVISAMIAGVDYLSTFGNLGFISLTIFIVSWGFQFWGHKIEGAKPSFFQDLVFLLIGPLWVLKFFYQKLGISK